MAETGDLVLLVANSAGLAARLFRINHEAALSELLNEALFHYKRDPGWFEVTVNESRFYACQLVTIPLLAFVKKRVPAIELQAAATRMLGQLSSSSNGTDPDAWILINADFLSPLTRPGVNLWHSRKVKNCLEKAIFTEPGKVYAPENKTSLLTENKPVHQPPKNSHETKKKNINGPDAEKVMERVMLGWRVKDICKEQSCSESYVYKLIKIMKGTSAMDYRWKQWELISAMYHAEPKLTIEQIEKSCGVSRAVVYHAVRKISERNGKNFIPRIREKKLTPEDVELIKIKLTQGALRKDIMKEYNIAAETLIRYVGKHEDYSPVPEDIKDYAIRLRVQGKTLQQTADILGVTVSTVKDAWNKRKNSPEISEARVKYDNRNVLSKRDRDQAVNAVIRDGHTRKQVYTQYGINALTLRRYIRDAQKKETNALRGDSPDTKNESEER